MNPVTLLSNSIVEVRVPTFKRPEMLLRALNCLRDQTHAHWIATVYDDSPEQEARQAVASLEDSRIQVWNNRERLGAAGNLDQCFEVGPLMGGQYAFVLEDDNGLKPDFIAANVEALRCSGLALLQRNQLIYDQTQQGWKMTDERTKSRVYPTLGRCEPIYVHGSIFFNDCIANGGLFWDTARCSSRLRVGQFVADSGLQEFCRTVQINEPMLCCPEPLGIWTRIPPSEVKRSFLKHRLFGRGLQALQLKLLEIHGARLITLLHETARTLHLEEGLTMTLAALGLPSSLKHVWKMPNRRDGLLVFSKGLARRYAVNNVLRDYLKTFNHDAAREFTQD